MSPCQKVPGVVKTRLTGNQRKKLRIMQASKAGISESELLSQRQSKMEEWQKEKNGLIKSRCPNCGFLGHSFKFCPFAREFPFGQDNVIRFRGPNGSWGCEPPLDLSLEERQRFYRHFKFLSMPIAPKSKNIHQKSEEEKGHHHKAEPDHRRAGPDHRQAEPDHRQAETE
jgi:hypothetical protein